jgi:hypothetical protein
MKYSASRLTPFPATFPRKILCKTIASAKNSASAPAIPLSTFKMNTCKSASKERTLTPSRMNTYAKPRGRAPLLLTSWPPRVAEAGLYARLASEASALRRFPHLSICNSFVFLSLRVAFFSTRLFSQTSALPPVFFKFLCSGLAARAANSAEGKALR